MTENTEQTTEQTTQPATQQASEQQASEQQAPTTTSSPMDQGSQVPKPEPPDPEWMKDREQKDANNHAVHEVLEKIAPQEDGEHPVAFFSRVVKAVQEAGHDISDAFAGVGLSTIDDLPVGTDVRREKGYVRLVTADGRAVTAPTTADVLKAARARGLVI